MLHCLISSFNGRPRQCLGKTFNACVGPQCVSFSGFSVLLLSLPLCDKLHISEGNVTVSGVVCLQENNSLGC